MQLCHLHSKDATLGVGRTKDASSSTLFLLKCCGCVLFPSLLDTTSFFPSYLLYYLVTCIHHSIEVHLLLFCSVLPYIMTFLKYISLFCLCNEQACLTITTLHSGIPTQAIRSGEVQPARVPRRSDLSAAGQCEAPL